MQSIDTKGPERNKIQYLINKKAQNAFDQLNRKIIDRKYNVGPPEFPTTGFRENISKILEESKYFDSVFEFCAFTGDYQVLQHEDTLYVLVVDRTFGVLAFCLMNESPDRRFNEFIVINAMFLDLDYNNSGQPVSSAILTA